MSALHEPAGITRKEIAQMNFLTAHGAWCCDTVIASTVLSALIAGWAMSLSHRRNGRKASAHFWRIAPAISFP